MPRKSEIEFISVDYMTSQLQFAAQVFRRGRGLPRTRREKGKKKIF
jgi:hypothetical protein